MTVKHCSFYITLTTEEKIKCWTIDEEERKKMIELKEGEEEYDCSIQFDRNEIIYCSPEEKEGTMKFLNDMISQPREMKNFCMDTHSSVVPNSPEAEAT